MCQEASSPQVGPTGAGSFLSKKIPSHAGLSKEEQGLCSEQSVHAGTSGHVVWPYLGMTPSWAARVESFIPSKWPMDSAWEKLNEVKSLSPSQLS